MTRQKKLIIACDGESASGKSTAAKLISKKYKLLLINSGLLYRYASKLIIKHKPKNQITFVKNKFKNISILLNSHIFESIQIIAENKISMVPVINEANNYVGYINSNDIIAKIGVNYDIDTTTSIIVISINRKDYTLHEISRLVEENNGKIVTLWTEPKKDKINLHLLITCPNSTSIIQSLERYNYIVSETFLKNITSNNLDDRFESFIKYLNT